MTGRSQIVVRDTVVEDAAELIGLWDECGRDGGDGDLESLLPAASWRDPQVAEAAAALSLNMQDPTRRMIVALIEGQIVGATVCSLSTLTPITLARVLLVTEIQVSPRFRRRSVAATLLSSVAAYGEEHDCQVVVAAIPVHAREPHRYLTKLGFSQVAVVRAIAATRLQSRLSGKTAHSRDTGKLIAMRRTLRRRQGEDSPAKI
ncbi:N-acetyltransferase family protein [Aeromicrobium sp. CF3.5]|uniref:GNAT family N-acetyltransferase n=1 Tax=Aeromicrobium sp. CF3.5 TaxID=3373078 RepID=UPI003EE627B8